MAQANRPYWPVAPFKLVSRYAASQQQNDQ